MVKKFAYITLDEEPETIVSDKESICAQLKELGLKRGMVVLVQGDTKNMGHFIGGEQMIIEALMETVGYEGTIVMPTFTPFLADPACQKNPISRSYWEDVRESALPFNKKLTMPDPEDTLANQFLRNEGVARSYHPLYSFAAWGKYAKLICDKHPLHFGLNEDSPLGKIMEFNGFVVLLGVPYEESVIFKLAQYQEKNLPIKIISAPIENNRHIEWKSMLDYDLVDTDLGEIGDIMEERSIIRSNYIAMAKCLFFSTREAVTLATSYFHLQKDATNCSQN